MESLLTRYWPPVFWYIRKKGYERELAKDLTQDFFHEVVLGKSLLEHADQAKGRLRNFLLVALERFLVSFERKRSALKRRPDQHVVSLGDVNLPEPATKENPEQAYCRAWAAELLDRALAELCEVCHRSGKTKEWSVFCDRILDPIFNDSDQPAFSEICRLSGIENESKASNMVTTVKRRFRSILRRHLRESVGSDDKVDAELMELLKSFSS
ncbi:MAG: sigma-70 family RNA polymerase sigma factor [Phycisphaerae bacterium]|nr:sigma-70 family RNA polymerase sigma factor [Phycisphaerae bacterium]